MNLKHFFPSSFTPTLDQENAIVKVDAFLRSQDQVMVLKGYAGTGKTTLVSGITKFLDHVKRDYFLMAPTGKAAKVISKYSGKPAYTIHKKIYRQQTIPGTYRFILGNNTAKGAVFIVDEASMIGMQGDWGGNGLLYDLFEYLYNGENCQMILVGDDAQLPPVGENLSPALDPKTINAEIADRCDAVVLTEVVRQALDSGILFNATKIRSLIESNEVKYPQFNLKGFKDIELVNGAELQEKIEEAYYQFGEENTVVLARSNETAYLYNQQLRNRVFFHDSEITGGEKLMVVKNNYFYTKDYEKLGFLANGDTIEIKRVLNEDELYGFRFMDVIARLKDYDADPEIELKIILESLQAEGPSLSKAETDELIKAVAEDYPHEENRRKKWALIKENPFFNAVQVKYAYCITGHKAQGGQWDCVFIDQSYFKEDMLNIDYLRWLYTCFTRAKHKLYLVNFKPQFFVD